MSVNTSDAVLVPPAVGLNVTLAVQVWVGATVTPEHASALMAKSPLLVPLMATDRTIKLVVPVSVTVTVCAALVVLIAWVG